MIFIHTYITTMDLQKLNRHLSLNKIFFITIICVSMAMDVLSDACNTPCSCEMETEGLIVNCAARELTAVPADIPMETVILRLSDNSISSVSVEDFKYLGSLQRLYLDGNSLRSDMISVGAFQNLENLEYLDLSDNRIRPETSHMTALLQPLTSLIWLDLSDNNIPMITQGMITIFDRLQTLTLTGNALACNCDILWLKNWLLNTRFAPPIVNGAECYSPSSLRRQQVAYAQFCPGAGRCYQCNNAASNEDCTSIQDCSADQDACQNVIRTSNGVKRISKGCQQLQACLNNNGGNLESCDTDQPDSACWHCCQGDLCNMPETAVVIDGCRVDQTPNQYVYRYPWPRVPNTVTAVTFKLRANNDGHIALSDERVDKDELIEIVLGGWKNNKSVIRSCKQCSPLAEASTPDLLMSPTEDKHFYITFEGSVINVGIVGMAPILSHQFDEEPIINFIGISTGWGSTGQWTFCGYGPILTPGTTSAPMVSVTGSVPVIPEVCYAEVSNEGDKGKISWPETTPEVTIKVKCPYQTAVGDTTYARRTCAWTDTSGAYWMDADVDDCPTDTEILEELADEDITEDNAEEVSDMLAVVTSNPDSLNDNDINNAVITIEHLSDSIDTLNPTTNTDILTNVLTTVNNMVDVPIIELEASQREENTSSRILKTVDEFALRVQFSDTSIIQNTQAVDMAVAKIDNTNLNTDVLFRSVGTKDTNYQPELYLNFSLTGFNIVDDDDILQASILLPNSLLQTVADDIDRCQFNLFQDTTFFEVIDVGGPTSNSQDQSCNPSTSDDLLQATDCESPNEEDNQQNGDNEDIITILNSVVISGSIGDLEVNDLDEPAIIKLRNINEDAFNPRCVFWDVNMKNGKGGWSEKGCRVNEEESSKSLTVCECDHLTNFAMIMDVYKDGSQLSRGHTIALSVISYIGCAVSFIALLLTLLTYTMCGRDKKKGKRRDRRSGRRDKRTKILLNLVVALLLVNLFFICGALVADYSGSGPLCVAMAAILHYFLLSAMMWMALEAFDMYMALVKVFESYYSHYLLKMCIAGWGLPVIAIAFTAGFDINNYGYHSGLCWLSTIPFYAAFLAPVCLILLFNSIVFIMVTKQLCDMRKRKITKSDSFDLAAQLRASFSITFLLGLTWILAIFAVGSADLTFSYLFAIFNSLQGFSLFFFQCVLNPDIRKRWFRVCCPKCAPPEDDPYPSNDATTRRITQQQKISTSSMSPLAVSTRISQFENGHYDNNSNGHTYDNSSNGHTYDNSSNTYHPTSYTDNTYDNAGPYDPDYEAIQPMPLPPRTTTT